MSYCNSFKNSHLKTLIMWLTDPLLVLRFWCILLLFIFFLIINFRFMIPNFGILIQPVPDYPSKNQIFRMVCRLFNGKLVSSTLLDRVRHVSFLIRSRICFIFSRIITKKTKLSPSPIKNKHTNNFFRVDIIHILHIISRLG